MKIVCNQCKKCAVENTAVLGCADATCSCHTIQNVDLEPCLWNTCTCLDEEEHRLRNN